MKKKKEEKLLHQLQEQWDGYFKPHPTISSMTSGELEQIYHNKVVPSSNLRTDCHSIRWRTFFMTLIISTPLVVLSVVVLLQVLPAPDGYVMNLTADHEVVSAGIIQILHIL